MAFILGRSLDCLRFSRDGKWGRAKKTDSFRQIDRPPFLYWFTCLSLRGGVCKKTKQWYQFQELTAEHFRSLGAMGIKWTDLFL